MLLFVFQICYYIADRLENAKKKIPCRIHKLSTAIYFTPPPPFRLLRNLYYYENFKKHYLVVTYILLYIRKNGLTPTRYTLPHF